MQNHEFGKTRPTYFTIKDNDILWFIPLSTRVEKYQKIIDRKIKKYGACKSIMIKRILGQNQVILLQNAFPTLEKYIDHVHIKYGKPAKVIKSIQLEVIKNFEEVLDMKEKGVNLFFTDIDKLKQELLENEVVKN